MAASPDPHKRHGMIFRPTESEDLRAARELADNYRRERDSWKARARRAELREAELRRVSAEQAQTLFDLAKVMDALGWEAREMSERVQR